MSANLSPTIERDADKAQFPSPTRRDPTGERYGWLVVTGFSHRGAGTTRGLYWHCVCDCGTSTVATLAHLTSGHKASCGCLRHGGRPPHGMKKTSTYAIWKGLRRRCNNPADPSFADYGGRGITTPPEWEYFPNFLEDMGERPHGLSIERIDNNRGYCKENCVWADNKTQCRNKRSNRFYTFGGNTLCLAAWAEELGVSRSAISYRLRNGMPFPEIVNLYRNQGVAK